MGRGKAMQSTRKSACDSSAVSLLMAVCEGGHEST